MSEPTVHVLVDLSHRWFPFLLPLPVAFGLGLRFIGKWQVACDLDARRPRIIPVARMACGALLILSLAVLGVAFMHLGCAALVAHRSTCQSNLKQLGAAMLLYAQDHDDRFPPADHWADTVAPYISKVASTDRASPDPFHCPAASTPGSYGMNAALSGLRESDLDSWAETVLLFDADAPTRSFAGSAPAVAWGRHGRVPNVAYADGHARYVTPGVRSSLRWSPR